MDVIKATCSCLVATSEESAAMGHTDEQAEQLILEEFGRCLDQVIEAASRSTGGFWLVEIVLCLAKWYDHISYSMFIVPTIRPKIKIPCFRFPARAYFKHACLIFLPRPNCYLSIVYKWSRSKVWTLYLNLLFTTMHPPPTSPPPVQSRYWPRFLLQEV